MNIFVAILGLGLLVFVHEAGHFFTARAVGMTPRRFYIGFPPPIVKRQAQGHRVRHRSDPARRLREDPGMHRPAPSDLDTFFGPALAEAPELLGADRARQAPARRGRHGRRARELLPELEQALDEASSQPRGARQRREGPERARRTGSAADAYWRQRTWKKVAVIFAGPGTNLLFAIVLFAALFVIGGGGYRLGVLDGDGGRRSSTTCDGSSRRRRSGSQPGDRIVDAINGQPVQAESTIADAASSVEAAARSRSTVRRDGGADRASGRPGRSERPRLSPPRLPGSRCG